MTATTSARPVELDAPREGLMDRLKVGTADRHHHAETRPLQRAMAAGTIAPATWRAWAAQMHAVHAALEEAVGSLDEAGVPASITAAARGHAARLAADVRALGGDPTGTELLPAARGIVETIREAAAAEGPERFALLGGLYVLEGSMNGNRFLAKRIAGAWGNAEGLSYLDPYGSEQRARWTAWRGEANALGLSAEADAAVIRGAEAMFDAIAALGDEVAAATD